jgi:mRNA-degrading endonuclease YafQ of YafQ-DinJ toxin-antitoxin module
MEILWDNQFKRAFKKITKKNPGLQRDSYGKQEIG